MAAPEDRARDRHSLPLTAGQCADLRADRGQHNAEALEPLLHLAPHCRLVEPMQRPENGARPILLAAEKHVLGDVERRYEREALEDGLDPGGPRLRGRRERALLAVDEDRAVVGADRA